MQLVFIIYSNQAEEFDPLFLSLGVSRVGGEQVAFWNSHQSLGRQMTERFMKYIHWDFYGKACEGISEFKGAGVERMSITLSAT